MTQKVLDDKGRWRHVIVGFRVTPSQKAKIDEYAKAENMGRRTYICEKIKNSTIHCKENKKAYLRLAPKYSKLSDAFYQLQDAIEASDDLCPREEEKGEITFEQKE